MITVINTQALKRLERALNAAVAAAPELAGARAYVLQSPNLLRALGADATSALAGDPQAMERLRTMLAITTLPAIRLEQFLAGQGDGDGSSPLSHIPAGGALGLGASAGGGGGDGLSLESESGDDGGDDHDLMPCDLGLLDLGGLTVVGLAAGRVGARRGHPRAFVRVVLGLALAAAPAEVLARSIRNGLRPNQVRATLATFRDAKLDEPGSHLMAMFLDECEQARWRCLEAVFARVVRQVQSMAWDAVVGFPIESVELDGPRRLKVGFDPGLDDRAEAEALGLNWDDLHAALKSGEVDQAALVFASKHHDPIAQPAHSANHNNRHARVRIPDNARSGWLGVALPQTQARVHETAETLRKQWEHFNDTLPCLRDTPVPLEALPTAATLLAAPPPWTPSASWGMRILEVELAQDHGEPMRPDTATHVRIKVGPVDAPGEVEVELGDFSERAPLERGRAVVELPAEHVSSKGVVTVGVYREGGEHPEDRERHPLEFDAATQPGDVDGPGDGVDPQPGDDDGDGRTPARITVIRFARRVDDRVHRVAATDVAAAIAEVERRGFDVERIDVPVLMDDDVLVGGFPDDSAGPRIVQLAEQLAELAARTPGLEDSIWIGLVPLPARRKRGVALTVPAAAARSIAVCSVDRLADVVASVDEPSAGVSNRLRLVGSLSAGDLTLTEPLRTEVRRAGPGGAYTSTYVASLFGTSGQVVTQARLATTNPVRLGRFVGLLDVGDLDVGIRSLRFGIDPNLFALELSATPQLVVADAAQATAAALPRYFALRASGPAGAPEAVLPYFDRPGGRPSVELLGLPDREEPQTLAVEWRYAHDRGVRPRFELEVGRRLADGREVFSRIARPQPSQTHAELPSCVRAPGEEPDALLRVVASDGWNTAIPEALNVRLASGLTIRHVGRGSFWADVAEGLEGRTITWRVRDRFDAELLPADHLFMAPPGDIGRWLDVEVADEGATASIRIPDWRALE